MNGASSGHVPPDVMAILRWHADRLPTRPMQESDLLFPSETGGFRSATRSAELYTNFAVSCCLEVLSPRRVTRTPISKITPGIYAGRAAVVRGLARGNGPRGRGVGDQVEVSVSVRRRFW